MNKQEYKKAYQLERSLMKSGLPAENQTIKRLLVVRDTHNSRDNGLYKCLVREGRYFEIKGKALLVFGRLTNVFNY